MAVLPLLSQYLGHKNIYSTQNYLQFTADMFPYVTETVQAELGNVIPGMASSSVATLSGRSAPSITSSA